METTRYKPPQICKVCGEQDCENEMCSQSLYPDLHLMLGDQAIPQVGSEELGRFFQPLDYEELAI